MRNYHFKKFFLLILFLALTLTAGWLGFVFYSAQPVEQVFAQGSLPPPPPPPLPPPSTMPPPPLLLPPPPSPLPSSCLGYGSNVFCTTKSYCPSSKQKGQAGNCPSPNYICCDSPTPPPPLPPPPSGPLVACCPKKGSPTEGACSLTTLQLCTNDGGTSYVSSCNPNPCVPPPPPPTLECEGAGGICITPFGDAVTSCSNLGRTLDDDLECTDALDVCCILTVAVTPPPLLPPTTSVSSGSIQVVTIEVVDPTSTPLSADFTSNLYLTSASPAIPGIIKDSLSLNADTIPVPGQTSDLPYAVSSSSQIDNLPSGTYIASLTIPPGTEVTSITGVGALSVLAKFSTGPDGITTVTFGIEIKPGETASYATYVLAAAKPKPKPPKPKPICTNIDSGGGPGKCVPGAKCDRSLNDPVPGTDCSSGTICCVPKKPIVPSEDKGVIKIRKKTEKYSAKDGDEFKFTVSGPTSKTVTIIANPGINGRSDDKITVKGLKPGKYTVKEIVPTDWILDSVSCGRAKLTADRKGCENITPSVLETTAPTLIFTNTIEISRPRFPTSASTSTTSPPVSPLPSSSTSTTSGETSVPSSSVLGIFIDPFKLFLGMMFWK